MKTILLSIAALATAATLVTVAPASAQDLGIRAGNGGVSVRVGDGDRHHDRGWREHRRHSEAIVIDRRDRGWREHRRHRQAIVINRRDRAECRTTTVRSHRPDGSVVIRKRSSC